jgi:hypothetical protein
MKRTWKTRPARGAISTRGSLAQSMMGSEVSQTRVRRASKTLNRFAGNMHIRLFGVIVARHDQDQSDRYGKYGPSLRA